ncbi:MAG TPA: hypothetical protein VH012_06700 [Acidimicrobiales bacterium]|jgi:hypothetical protein|nr:hypothetical protein [Acidimicrobiales bacterium]
MTDLIERVDAVFTADGAQTETTPQQGSVGGASTGRPLQILLAVTLGGSAVLLFAMASGHLKGTQATIGVVAALVQVALAIGAFTRPSRVLFGVVAATNAAVAVFWLGVEGPHTVSMATAAIGVALSGIAVVVGAALAIRPTLGSAWSSATSVFGSLLPLAVVGMTIGGLFGTTAALSAPVAAASHSSDAVGNASAKLAQATTVTVPGETSKSFASTLAGNSTEKAENALWVPLNPTDQAALTAQLAESYQAAMRFPTVASAKAAHMILAGGMAPGVGAHYQLINADLFKGINPDGTVNALYPASWIYASTADNAPVVGIMYESFAETAPTGFVGPNDHWHRHSDVCVKTTANEIVVPFAADQDVTPKECADVGGNFMKKTIWMVHAWVVPGWESPQGVFSHDNLHVYCPGNTDLVNAIGFCDRQS